MGYDNIGSLINNMYSQVSGTMMGTPFAVEYSCLAMSYQEKIINETYDDEKPIFLVRYIDDIFGISTMSDVKLYRYTQFVQNHPLL